MSRLWANAENLGTPVVPHDSMLKVRAGFRTRSDSRVVEFLYRNVPGNASSGSSWSNSVVVPAAHQADFNKNSAAGLRASDVWIKYDSTLQELQYSVEWSICNGCIYYVKSGLTDEDLEIQKASKKAEGYSVARLRSAYANGKKYHMVLWTKDPNASSPQVSQDGSQSQK